MKRDQSETFTLIKAFLDREGIDVQRLSGVVLVEVGLEWLLAVNGTRQEKHVDPPECSQDCCVPPRGMAFWHRGLLALVLAIPAQGFDFRPLRYEPQADERVRKALAQALRAKDAPEPAWQGRFSEGGVR